MFRTGTIMLVLLGALGAAGCGEAATQASPATPAQQKPEEWKLGKYSSTDGMVQMVIDRTAGPKAKIQMSGSNDIVELTPEEVRSRGDLQGYLFKAPDGTRTLFLSVAGALTFLRGRDELPLRRDADAAPLGPATIAGAPPATPPPQKSEQQVAAETLTAISVVKKLPRLTSKDALKLPAVGEAFAGADAGMFVHFVLGSGTNVHYSASLTTMFGAHAPIPAGPLQAHGGELLQLIRVERGRHGRDELKHWGLQVGTAVGGPRDGMPGLVWEVEGTHVTFVTADGGRYAIDLEQGGATVAPGVDASLAKWPAPLAHAVLGPGELSHFAEAGVVDAKTLAPIDKLQDTWRACVDKSFKGLQKELGALDRQNLDDTARSARKKLATEKWDDKVRDQCKATKPKMEAALASVIEARNKDRLALFEKVKARAAQLGIAK